MPCGREILLRRVKSLRRWGFISFHLMRSGKYHNLQSKLFHRERSERFHFLLRLNALNIGRGSCQGSEHRAACGRWSGALSRKKQRALRAPQASKATMFLTDRVVGSSPTGGAKKSRETLVFLLFFYFTYWPKPMTLPHTAARLLTGSEHRAACGRWSNNVVYKNAHCL